MAGHSRPEVYTDIYKWQWENKLIPYWKEIGEMASEYGVKIGIELHAVSHTVYALKLRENTL